MQDVGATESLQPPAGRACLDTANGFGPGSVGSSHRMCNKFTIPFILAASRCQQKNGRFLREV